MPLTAAASMNIGAINSKVRAPAHSQFETHTAPGAAAPPVLLPMSSPSRAHCTPTSVVREMKWIVSEGNPGWWTLPLRGRHAAACRA